MQSSVLKILTDDELAAVARGEQLGLDGPEPFRLAQRRVAEYAVTDRCRLLAGLLAGDEKDDGEAERKLGVRFADHHWAVVLRSVPSEGLNTEDMVRFALAVARQVAGTRPLVTIEHTTEVWMWTSFPDARFLHDLAAACADLLLPDGPLIGAGPITFGAAGFRQSLLGARAALRAHPGVSGSRWHSYREASPVSLLTLDQDQARWFIDDVLGELGRDEPKFAMLRETLRLYLARGRSRRQTASELYVNRNTVGYRLEKAAHLLGRSIDGDAFDIRMALEIAARAYQYDG